ncbi:MAG: YIP1 family protein [Anaeromyxobacter sp.]
MTASDLSADGTLVLRTLTSPERTLTTVVARRRAFAALLVSTVAAVLFAAFVLPHVDFGMGSGGGPDMTAFEREEAAITAHKLGLIFGWARALVGPTLRAGLVALGLFLGFRAAGASPTLRASFAVSAHALVPVWLGGLLYLPLALLHGPLPLEELPGLVPASLAALAPGAPHELEGALLAVDVFNLWALGLMALGMARAAGTSRTRAVVTTLVLFLCYVALFRVAGPAFMSGGPGPGPH